MVRTRYHTLEDNDLEWLEKSATHLKRVTLYG